MARFPFAGRAEPTLNWPAAWGTQPNAACVSWQRCSGHGYLQDQMCQPIRAPGHRPRLPATVGGWRLSLPCQSGDPATTCFDLSDTIAGRPAGGCFPAFRPKSVTTLTRIPLAPIGDLRLSPRGLDRSSEEGEPSIPVSLIDSLYDKPGQEIPEGTEISPQDLRARWAGTYKPGSKKPWTWSRD
jgi:hypothetical protein